MICICMTYLLLIVPRAVLQPGNERIHDLRGPTERVVKRVAQLCAVPDCCERRATEQASHRQARDPLRRDERVHGSLDPWNVFGAGQGPGVECVNAFRFFPFAVGINEE